MEARLRAAGILIGGFMLQYWIHPFCQALATAVAVYALYLAAPRVLSAHFGRRGPFAWKDHVRFGGWGLVLWLVGTLIGILVVRVNWMGFFITGVHAWAGLLMAAFAVFGYATGRHMDAVKARRPAWMPVAHGLNNAVLIGLALWQAWTGWGILP